MMQTLRTLLVQVLRMYHRRCGHVVGVADVAMWEFCDII